MIIQPVFDLLGLEKLRASSFEPLSLL